MLRVTRWLPLGALLVASTASVVLACGAFGGDEATPAEDAGPSPEASTVDAAPPPPDACVSANVASDPNNCGACGHSCLGGDCAAGVCLPTIVATSVGEGVYDVAVDAKRVLWMTATGGWGGYGHVYSCPKGPCSSPVSLAAPNTVMGNLTASDTDAFVSFSYGSRVIERILPDDTLTPLPTKPHDSAVRLQVSNGHLLYLSLNEQGAVGPYAGSVFEWDGMNERLLAQFDGATNYNDLTAVGNDLYLSSYVTIAKCTLGKCATFTGQTSGVTRMTTDGSRVIWAANVVPEIRACATGAAVTSCPTPTTLLGAAQLKTQPLFVTVSRGKLYVTTKGGDILECDPANCTGTLRTIAHEDRLYVGGEPTFGGSVVADDTAIYWAAVDGKGPLVDAGPDGSIVENTSLLKHRIMRLAK
jgi:hypothetical protein